MSEVRHVCRLATTDEWTAAQTSGRLNGSDFDRKGKDQQGSIGYALIFIDGYIHLSTSEQANETFRKYFSGRSDVWLLTVDTKKLPAPLKWEFVAERYSLKNHEISCCSNGVFPHYYDSSIPIEAVCNPPQIHPWFSLTQVVKADPISP